MWKPFGGPIISRVGRISLVELGKDGETLTLILIARHDALPTSGVLKHIALPTSGALKHIASLKLPVITSCRILGASSIAAPA
jgi:hypothetical protein